MKRFTDLQFCQMESSLDRAAILSNISRPFKMLEEPILIGFSAWVSVFWIVMYFGLETIPIFFPSVYGFSTGQAGLVFIAVHKLLDLHLGSQLIYTVS